MDTDGRYMFAAEETRSRFTAYSMSSSVCTRNNQLRLERSNKDICHMAETILKANVGEGCVHSSPVLFMVKESLILIFIGYLKWALIFLL